MRASSAASRRPQPIRFSSSSFAPSSLVAGIGTCASWTWAAERPATRCPWPPAVRAWSAPTWPGPCWRRPGGGGAGPGGVGAPGGGGALFSSPSPGPPPPPPGEPISGEPFVFTQFAGEPQCFLTEVQLTEELLGAGFEENPPRPPTPT